MHTFAVRENCTPNLKDYMSKFLDFKTYVFFLWKEMPSLSA